MKGTWKRCILPGICTVILAVSTGTWGCGKKQEDPGADFPDKPVSVTVPYENQEDLLDSQDESKEKNTVVPVEREETLYIDVDDDGEEEQVEVLVKYQKEKTDPGDTLLLRVDGRSISQPLNGLLTGGYIFRQENGQTWLYAEAAGDNDCRSVAVFDLSGEKPAFQGTSAVYFDDLVPMDSEKFWMKARMCALSTYEACGKFKIGEDGLPQMAEFGYQMDFTGAMGEETDVFSGIRTRREIPAKRLTEEGRPGEKSSIPKGTLVKFIGTDNKKYVDMETEQGERYRVFYKTKVEWVSYTIGGIDIFDCFDGLIFAG